MFIGDSCGLVVTFIRQTALHSYIVLNVINSCGSLSDTHPSGRSVLEGILSWSWGLTPCQQPLALQEG